MRVLIAETNQGRAQECASQLAMDGHDATLALSERMAAIKLAELPDAVVLSELGGPVRTIALLRALRNGEIPGSDSDVPVIVVGVDHAHTAIRYYRAGADIALAVASPPLLIAAALDALARRTAGHQRRRIVRVGQLTVDRDARIASLAGELLALTRLEFDLLATLASAPQKAFTRDELTRDVWGYDPAAAGPSRTIDATAHRLRRKLEQAGCEPIVHNVRGVGWRLAL